MDRYKTKPKVRKIPGPNARRWINFHMKYAARSTYEPEFIWNRNAPAIGPFCTDVDGNVIMDFTSHIASNPLGYNNKELLAVARKVLKSPDRYAGTDFIAGFGKVPGDIPTPSHLHHKLTQITKQFGFNTSFFSNSGTEAVENAIKIAYAKRKNRGYGFAFEGAFHGRTLGALSLNFSRTEQKKFYPKIPEIIHLPYCSCKRICNCGWQTRTGKGVISKLEYFLDKGLGKIDPQEVSYVIMEPMQGEGGYIFPNKNFVKEVRKTTKKYGIPLIVDEIQTGLGRSGKWWAIEHYNVKPDIITAAKALRIGATISKRSNFPNEDGRISGTWSEGNAVASAVGYKTIEIIQKKKLLRNSELQGKYFLKALQDIKSKNIYEVRGLGLLLTIELKDPNARNNFVKTCLSNGLLIHKCGYKGVRILPPLDVNKREIDLALEIINKSIK